MLVSLLIGSFVFFAFALSESFAFSLAMLLAWGVGAAFFMNLTTTLIQSRTPNDVMGRVMSVQMLSFFGLSPDRRADRRRDGAGVRRARRGSCRRGRDWLDRRCGTWFATRSFAQAR